MVMACAVSRSVMPKEGGYNWNNPSSHTSKNWTSMVCLLLNLVITSIPQPVKKLIFLPTECLWMGRDVLIHQLYKDAGVMLFDFVSKSEVGELWNKLLDDPNSLPRPRSYESTSRLVAELNQMFTGPIPEHWECAYSPRRMYEAFSLLLEIYKRQHGATWELQSMKKYRKQGLLCLVCRPWDWFKLRVRALNMLDRRPSTYSKLKLRQLVIYSSWGPVLRV